MYTDMGPIFLIFQDETGKQDVVSAWQGETKKQHYM